MTIISTKCNICHATASASFGNLDLISAGVASRLVGVATYANGECKGKGNLLDSGSNPATGVFIQKLNPNPSCGDQMPPGSPLQSDDIACLTAWAGTLTAGGK